MASSSFSALSKERSSIAAGLAGDGMTNLQQLTGAGSAETAVHHNRLWCLQASFVPPHVT